MAKREGFLLTSLDNVSSFRLPLTGRNSLSRRGCHGQVPPACGGGDLAVRSTPDRQNTANPAMALLAA